MRVLITKVNQPFFLDFDSKLKFKESTKNTCTFNITEEKFIKLKEYVRSTGNNPFAIMSW